MNKYALIVLLVLVSILAFYLGRKLYKVTHDGFVRDNVSVIIFLMRAELKSIDHILKNSSDPKTDQEKKIKQMLLQRRSEIINDLNLFYGNNIFGIDQM